MSVINTTMKLWIGVTKRGEMLGYGNPNKHLSYHLISWWTPLNNRIVYGTRRWEIMEHIKKWNKQCGNEKDWKCKAVKAAITCYY